MYKYHTQRSFHTIKRRYLFPLHGEVGARKQVILPQNEVEIIRDLTNEKSVLNKNSSSITNGCTANTNTEGSNRNNWIEVKAKKYKYSRNDVKKGGNTSMEIQGIEKYTLHVWRLKKDTTAENLENLVRRICGKKITIKIEKLKPYTERDNSSFMIGVPESGYEKLSKSEVWHLNVEFSE